MFNDAACGQQTVSIEGDACRTRGEMINIHDILVRNV